MHGYGFYIIILHHTTNLHCKNLEANLNPLKYVPQQNSLATHTNQQITQKV